MPTETGIGPGGRRFWSATPRRSKSRRKQPDAKQRLKEVTLFLLGEGQLDGRWFGDDPPTTPQGRPRPYWWRRHLRDATDAVLAELWKHDKRNLLRKD